MSEYENIAQRYIDAWNERDADKRGALIAEVFTPEATYTDPLAQVAGAAAIEQVIAGAQQQFPGLEFTLGPVDGHHDIARFTWLLGAPGAAEPLVIGFDAVALEGGRIKQVLGFLDKVPG
ncbi:nuclear transport factor 2 family protein [Nocardia sp. CDC159]|uniref:Nuclear transport factor 2 family protein n=1 Tax=Nocardia pulmonis TaxID=2951408 RepID=A0A9X2EC46_9NOCA|nr:MULTISPECIES: nuclear transport factor 2 family protein [Nocardia]MCM6775483.1 nuclear transport factor 2 family protein [Nocardia pulmonis]MCM6787783.1 nuclear transport factor 2 family protein [Nocardia sp. CDC159]